MTRTIARGVFVVLTLFCAVTAHAGKRQSGLMGMSIDTVIEHAGYPDSSFKGPNGNTVYVYTESNSYQTAPFSGHYGRYHRSEVVIPGQNVNLWCTVYMETDADGVVVAIRTKGNNCP